MTENRKIIFLRRKANTNDPYNTTAEKIVEPNADQ